MNSMFPDSLPAPSKRKCSNAFWPAVISIMASLASILTYADTTIYWPTPARPATSVRAVITISPGGKLDARSVPAMKGRIRRWGYNIRRRVTRFHPDPTEACVSLIIRPMTRH